MLEFDPHMKSLENIKVVVPMSLPYFEVRGSCMYSICSIYMYINMCMCVCHGRISRYVDHVCIVYMVYRYIHINMCMWARPCRISRYADPCMYSICSIYTYIYIV
jgi:hypothetical protein